MSGGLFSAPFLTSTNLKNPVGCVPAPRHAVSARTLGGYIPSMSILVSQSRLTFEVNLRWLVHVFQTELEGDSGMNSGWLEGNHGGISNDCWVNSQMTFKRISDESCASCRVNVGSMLCEVEMNFKVNFGWVLGEFQSESKVIVWWFFVNLGVDSGGDFLWIPGWFFGWISECLFGDF